MSIKHSDAQLSLKSLQQLFEARERLNNLIILEGKRFRDSYVCLDRPESRDIDEQLRRNFPEERDIQRVGEFLMSNYEFVKESLA